ncbi:MAG TPA: hypothetical protein VLK22_04555 [Candidatus Udaeobacter sp.]|nr:hypothetical protein [Candidatus Udaeobacter sp.]
MKKTFLLLAPLLLLTGAGCTIAQSTTKPISPAKPVYCTQDAKLCPDGSYVGRTGPNCEFTPCSLEKNCQNGNCTGNNEPQNSNKLKTYSIGGIVNFQVPASCNSDAGAGSIYIVCPDDPKATSSPQFVFSSDGIQVNMRRWNNYQSPYWDDVLASMKVVQPLTHEIQINIEK